jgi:excisionase family DNA binding protein
MSKNTDFLFENSEITEDSRSISTAQAAKMLGMSTTLMQQLVDHEKIKAWKTPGGHRRVDLSSLEAYRNRLRLAPDSKVKKPCLPVVKIVVEDASVAPSLQRELSHWLNYFDISCWHSLPEALLSFTSQLPDILIVQISIPLQQQLATVSAVGNFLEQAKKPFSVVCLSGVSGLKAKAPAGMSSSIQLVTQPFTYAWLNAFLMGVKAGSKAPKSRADELQW